MQEQISAKQYARAMLKSGYGTKEWHTLHAFKVAALVAVIAVSSFAAGVVATTTLSQIDNIQNEKITKKIQEQTTRTKVIPGTGATN